MAARRKVKKSKPAARAGKPAAKRKAKSRAAAERVVALRKPAKAAAKKTAPRKATASR